ncbi:MAG: hypothetical protein JWQ98_3564 [Chlorobi bacterium]|nr:hypothetical protein [Chlorobiota bacterium]
MRPRMFCLALIITTLGAATASAQKAGADMRTMYVVVADSSSDYQKLLGEAQHLSQSSGIPFDARDLIFTKEKGLHFPENDSDEIYAGDYLWRRFADESISLERRSAYFNNVKESDPTMIIVAGIFETKRKAAQALARISGPAPRAFIRATKLFMGCMH